MVSVIEAGPTAFLQCTARLALTEEARARLLRRLQAIDPRVEALEAEPLRVERVSFEVRTGSDWKSVAESTSSGMPPWTAALAATLARDALAAIKAALAGEKDRARLTARIVVEGSPAVTRHWAAAGETMTTTSATRASAGFTAEADLSSSARAPVAHELGADIASLLAEHVPTD
jgi:hypothetical protein